MAGGRQRLVSMRKAAGFSQERLAEVVGVERSTVQRWERGERCPQPWARPKLARALGISDQELAELLDEPAEPEGAASASGPITGEVAPLHTQDFPQHGVVLAAFDDARHYLDGEGIPSGWAPSVLCEALSRRLGRTVTLDELGLAFRLLSSHAALDWRADTPDRPD